MVTKVLWITAVLFFIAASGDIDIDQTLKAEDNTLPEVGVDDIVPESSQEDEILTQELPDEKLNDPDGMLEAYTLSQKAHLDTTELYTGSVPHPRLATLTKEATKAFNSKSHSVMKLKDIFMDKKMPLKSLLDTPVAEVPCATMVEVMQGKKKTLKLTVPDFREDATTMLMKRSIDASVISTAGKDAEDPKAKVQLHLKDYRTRSKTKHRQKLSKDWPEKHWPEYMSDMEVDYKNDGTC